jgi:hypothetical protein
MNPIDTHLIALALKHVLQESTLMTMFNSTTMGTGDHAGYFTGFYRCAVSYVCRDFEVEVTLGTSLSE